MGIFGGEKDKGDLAVVFDIWSSSVGGALFYKQKSGIPKIIFSMREPIMLENSIDSDKLLSSTVKALDTVAKKICTSGLGAPKNIFCVISSLWYSSQIRTIKLEKNTPFLFTSKLADSLIQKETTLFKEEHFPKYDTSGGGVRIIEMKNIKIMLNGYETAKPLDQKAKELEMTIFISMAGEKALKKIEDTLNKHFPHKEIKFSSFVMSSFTVVRDMYAKQESFLLIDIGGEVTDISMVKKNTLKESISFPLGINFITRQIAATLNCSLSEAKSYFSLFKDGHASSSATKKLEPIIGNLKNEWLKSFQESLANLSRDISVPANIYLATDKDFATFFSEIIKAEQFNQYTLAESNFEVISLDLELFHGLAVFEEEVVRDAILVIDAIYINRFLANNSI